MNRWVTTASALCCCCVLQSCVVFGSRDDFSYRPEKNSLQGAFVPDCYISKNTLNLPLLVARVDIDKLPHDLVMWQYDPTYLDADDGFRSFRILSMEIEYADGTLVPLPEADGDYLIQRRNKVLQGAISKRMDFTIRCRGFAVKKNGQKFPFKRVTAYRYDGKSTTFHTVVDEWASV